MSMGYEKDGFAFLIDGFELSKFLFVLVYDENKLQVAKNWILLKAT